jgi:hypothetical protein
MLAVPHAGVEPGIDNVDERALGDDLEIDLRIGSQKRCDHRRQHQIDRRGWRIDPQSPRQYAAQAPHLIKRPADIGDRRSDAGQQQFAGLGERDTAGGPVHQPYAETLLHVAQPLAQTRRRHALLARRAAEILGAGDGDEGVEIAEV